MNLLEVQKDPKILGYIFSVLALLLLLLTLSLFGLSWVFFFILILFILFIYFYFTRFTSFAFVMRLVLSTAMFLFAVLYIWIVFTYVPSVRRTVTTTGNRSQLSLVPCTSSPNAPIQSVAGMKAELYSGVLDTVKGSPDPMNKNNVRTFSLAGLKNKTEKNSFYYKMSKIDGSGIKGYDEQMEVCNKDNKASASYVTKAQADTDVVKEDNVTARISYFHGGNYILEPGTYRVDAYIRDLNGKWVLVAREEGITITE